MWRELQGSYVDAGLLKGRSCLTLCLSLRLSLFGPSYSIQQARPACLPHRVCAQVGGGSLADAAAQLAADPPTWAFLAAAALALTGRHLTPTLDLITASLAPAHAPLALLALGMTLGELTPPQPRQVHNLLFSAQ